MRAVPLIGRLLLVLAGAYLIRALTEEGTVPEQAGVVAGLLYAFAWIVAADRAGRAGSVLSASFHGTATALIAYPLIWETTAQFGFLSPTQSAWAVAGVSIPALLVATRNRLRGLAWILFLGAAGCAFLLMSRPEAVPPTTALYLLLGICLLWVGRTRDWPGLAWASALVADAAVLFLTARSLGGGEGRITPGTALTIQLALVFLYLGTFAYFSLRRQWRLTVFDVVQTALVLLIGFRGALAVAAETGTAETALGVGSLAAAVASYFVAFSWLQAERRRYFYYYTSVALVLVLLGSSVVLERPALPWSVLAIATAWLGARFGRVTLSLHGALYALAAALASLLLLHAGHAWAARAGTAWPTLSLTAYLALVAAAVCAWLPVRTDLPRWQGLSVLPRLVTGAVVVVGGGGVLLAGLVPPIAGTPGNDPDAAVLGVVRTFVLALATMACALAARSDRLRTASYFVYPLLVAGAIKLLLEDLPTGRAATLWISLLLYGLALITAPRIARSASAATPAEPPPAEGEG
jgi:hypothetical protein